MRRNFKACDGGKRLSWIVADNVENNMKIPLEEEKKIQIQILNAIDDFCSKNGIKYFLLYGTLLGAVRHKGFIPWDDDIDIGMFREDYNLFFDTFNQYSQNNGHKYEAIYINNNKKYYLPIGKVIDKDTILFEHVNVNCPLGVFIDVFPIDSLAASREDCVKLVKRIGIIERLLGYKQAFWSDRYSLIKNIFHMIVKAILFPFSNNYLCRQINRMASCKVEPETKNAGSIVLGVYGEKGIWDREDFDDSIKLEFEGKYYSAPSGYDNLLHRIYGDYMKLPPKEKQLNHHKNTAYWRPTK